MKKQLRTLIAGLALIAVTNTVALIGVNYNRSGEPDAVAVLTERELGLPHRYGFLKENSGIALNILWRMGHKAPYGPNNYDRWEHAIWLDKEKLETLGFDLSEPLTSEKARRYYEKMLPRDVYLVLEYDGDMHKQVIKRRKNELVERQALLTNNPEKEEFKKQVKHARDRLEAEEQFNSRLFVIDAGIDKAALRARYPDRTKYLIMAGQVDLHLNEDSFKGHIRGLTIKSVNVPLDYHTILMPLMDQDSYRKQPEGPRYSVKLAIGQRLEPWVKDVSLQE
jgi:hypothetical protein